MKRERGAADFLILVALVATLACVGAFFYGKSVGKDIAERDHLQANNEALTAAQAEATKLRGEKEAMEQAHAKRLREIDTGYQQEKQNAEAQRLADVAAARSGAIRLRDPGGKCATASGAGSVPTANPGAGRTESAGGTELSPAAVEFLLAEANRANAVVAKLNRVVEALEACEAVGR